MHHMHMLICEGWEFSVAPKPTANSPPALPARRVAAPYDYALTCACAKRKGRVAVPGLKAPL